MLNTGDESVITFLKFCKLAKSKQTDLSVKQKKSHRKVFWLRLPGTRSSKPSAQLPLKLLNDCRPTWQYCIISAFSHSLKIDFFIKHRSVKGICQLKHVSNCYSSLTCSVYPTQQFHLSAACGMPQCCTLEAKGGNEPYELSFLQTTPWFHKILQMGVIIIYYESLLNQSTNQSIHQSTNQLHDIQ